MKKKYKLFYETKDKLPKDWKCEHKSGRYGQQTFLKEHVISFLGEGARQGYFFVGKTKFSFNVEDFTVFDPDGKLIVIETKFGKTMSERSKENVDKEIDNLDQEEMVILSKNLRKGWQFKPHNMWKDFYRRQGDRDTQLYANINIKKVANSDYSKFGFEIFVCDVGRYARSPSRELHYGKGKLLTVFQTKKKVDELMCEADDIYRSWFYSIWDKKSRKIKWFQDEEEVLDSANDDK